MGKKCSIDTYNRRSAGGTVYRSYFKLKGCPDLFAKILIRDTAKRKAIQIWNLILMITTTRHLISFRVWLMALRSRWQDDNMTKWQYDTDMTMWQYDNDMTVWVGWFLGNKCTVVTIHWLRGDNIELFQHNNPWPVTSQPQKNFLNQNLQNLNAVASLHFTVWTLLTLSLELI